MKHDAHSLTDATGVRPRRRRLRAASLVAGVAALAALAMAAPAGAQTTTPRNFPFASGMVSDISGSTLDLNGRLGTSKVVVTSSTAYTQVESASTSDIATGDCVRAIGTGSAASGITATTVSLTKPTSKGCTTPRAGNFRGQGPNTGTGRRFGNGTGPNGGTGQASPNAPSGGTGSRPANFGAAFGTVKSISGNQLTVKAQVVTPSSSKNKKPKVTTQNVTVTLGDSTTIMQTVAATEKDIAVGACVTATGKTDSVGTVTASRVMISQPQNGACGFGGGFGGPGGFGGFNRQGNGQSGSATI
ncbi:MAG TPA: DUF5666 domain-containing protein [Acidimicrobiia bacterium]|nr:DUF5666 domain-containing protein [Acidimicrobiia bacterium]